MAGVLTTSSRVLSRSVTPPPWCLTRSATGGSWLSPPLQGMENRRAAGHEPDPLLGKTTRPAMTTVDHRLFFWRRKRLLARSPLALVPHHAGPLPSFGIGAWSPNDGRPATVVPAGRRLGSERSDLVFASRERKTRAGDSTHRWGRQGLGAPCRDVLAYMLPEGGKSRWCGPSPAPGLTPARIDTSASAKCASPSISSPWRRSWLKRLVLLALLHRSGQSGRLHFAGCNTPNPNAGRVLRNSRQLTWALRRKAPGASPLPDFANRIRSSPRVFDRVFQIDGIDIVLNARSVSRAPCKLCRGKVRTDGSRSGCLDFS